MSYIAKMPTTHEERKRKAEYIRSFQERTCLSNTWLIKQLADEGFRIAKTTASSALTLYLDSPKTREFLMRAERICKEYDRKYPAKQQSAK